MHDSYNRITFSEKDMYQVSNILKDHFDQLYVDHV